MNFSHDEVARLAALDRYVVSSAPETIFDDIVRLAAAMSGCPVALLGFMESEREWVKAQCGWPIATMPRNISLATEAIARREIVVIPDAAADLHYVSHPLVAAEPRVRFYAGAPLITRDGHVIGVLSVFDRTPRALNSVQRQTLVTLAQHVMNELDLRRATVPQSETPARNAADLAEALRESHERFDDLFDSVGDIIMNIAPDGRILHVNRACLDALQYEQNEIAEKSIFDIIPREQVENFRSTFNRLMSSGRRDEIETEFVATNGRRFSVEGEMSPKRTDGKAVHARAIFRDVSYQKRFEVELGQARDAALESARLKSQFLTNVSHEIRTPMNGVVGMLELLADSGLNAEQREYTKTALASADQLLGIINNILHMSKIEAGTLSVTVTDFDPVTTVNRVMEVMRVVAEEKGIEVSEFVDTELPAVLRGDVGRIRQILTNLVDNAIKFTDQGRIVVRVGKEAETETHVMVRFSVSDTGVGIAEEMLPKLFQPFAQVDGSLTREHGGVGLGLVTSKKLVELMGGLMSVESTPGEGSSFWFTIPFEKGISASVIHAAEQLDLKSARTLIVDLSDTSRRIIQHYLTNDWGMRAGIATSANDGLNELRKATAAGDPYRLVIFDLHLPEMDGLSFANAVKLDPLLASTGLILLTTIGTRLDDVAIRNAGIAAYLAKPVEQSELFDSLTTAVAREHTGPLPATAPPPVESLKTADVAIVAQPKNPYEGVRIMLAEDNLLNQKLTLSQLQKLGYLADAVSNGRDAVEAAQERKYDIILMDCQMPVMDGYQATMEIRRREGDAKRTTIIAMTAHALEGDREKCLAAGMDDYLAKPTKHEDLAATLARWSASHQIQG